MLYIVDNLTDTYICAKDEAEAITILQRRQLSDEKKNDIRNPDRVHNSDITTVHNRYGKETHENTTYGYNG